MRLGEHSGQARCPAAICGLHNCNCYSHLHLQLKLPSPTSGLIQLQSSATALAVSTTTLPPLPFQMLLSGAPPQLASHPTNWPLGIGCGFKQASFPLLAKALWDCHSPVRAFSCYAELTSLPSPPANCCCDAASLAWLLLLLTDVFCLFVLKGILE